MSEKSDDIELPNYTLRKKYTKRPAHVIKIRLKKHEAKLQLPESTVHRLWIIIDNLHVVIKTWHFSPLPTITDIFKDVEIDNITIEFNQGPHIQDVALLEKISTLNSSSFCLEFREHWAGLFLQNDEVARDKTKDTSNPSLYETHSDTFIEPFMNQETVCDKIRVITGRISGTLMQKLCMCKNLQFLGLRVNYDEYRVLVECIEEYKSLERIHILPQWKHDSKLTVAPLRFGGVVTVYYWDLETTQAVNKALKKWKRAQSKRNFLCWS